MKLCFFSGDITRSGGTERVSIQIASELQSRGHEVRFVSLTEQDAQPFYPIAPGIRRETLNDHWITNRIEYLAVMRRLRRYLRRERPDAVIDIDTVLDVLSIPVCRRYGIPVVAWEHFTYTFEQSGWYRRLISRLTVRKADRIVTLTERDRQSYLERGHRSGGITAIPNPMYPAIKQGLPKQKWIVTSGRMVFQKGMDYLIEAAEQVLTRCPDWVWYLLGDGPERSALEEELRRRSLSDRLILTGRVPNPEWYLEQAQLFVLTSRWEGLPMCLLEARAYGLPSVSFDIEAGPAEIIRDGQTGELIPPYDCGQMAECICRILQDDALRETYRSNSGKPAPDFEPRRCADRWEALLNGLNEERKHKGEL